MKGRNDAHAVLPQASRPTARCVVWLGQENETPHDLVDALRSRNVMVSSAVNAYDVMVQLTERHPRVLIVCEPYRQRYLEPLLAAVRKYYPAVLCRQYAVNGRSGHPELLPLANGAVKQPAAREPMPRPVLRFVPPSVALVEPPLISAEELAMLLGPEINDSATERESENRL